MDCLCFVTIVGILYDPILFFAGRAVKYSKRKFSPQFFTRPETFIEFLCASAKRNSLMKLRFFLIECKYLYF